MAKPKTAARVAPPQPIAPSKPYLTWPTHPKELSSAPRVFRIHRLNAFEWQAFVTEGGVELPIGKPDLFDILKNKVCGVMRAEGQAEYLAKRTADATREVENVKQG